MATPHAHTTGTVLDRSSARETLGRSLRPVRIVLSLAFVGLLLAAPDAVALSPGEALGLGLLAAGNALLNAAIGLGLLPLPARARSLAVQLAVDSLLALVGMLVLDSAATPLAWIALLLPVFDAGTAFGGGAALLTWSAASLAYVAIKIQTADAGEDGADVLVLAVQQLAAVAVVALPAMIVVSRLRDDLTHSHGARVAADRRSADLLVVGEAAERLAAAPDQPAVLGITLDCAAALGFESADVCERHGDRPWQLLRALGGRRGPDPAHDPDLDRVTGTGAPARIDAEAEDDGTLRLLGWRSGAVCAIDRREGHAVALRVWSRSRLVDRESALDAVELLATLAAGAWHSTRTLADLESWSTALAHQASHDELTGLANRAGLIERLHAAMVRIASTGGRCSVLFLDLDGFKGVNDSLGHDGGDAVLRTVATRIGRLVRGHDAVGRLGGDEFVVIVNEPAGPDEAEAIAARLCEAVSAPMAIGSEIARVGVSVGLAHARPGDTAEEILTMADHLMYEVKRSGGGRYAVETEETG